MNTISKKCRFSRGLIWRLWHLMLILIALIASNAQVAEAQNTHNWLGSGQVESSFNVASNWLQNEVPGPTDVAQFHIAFAIPLTVNFESDVIVDELQFLNSEYTFRSFGLNSDTPTMFETDLVDIDGGANLTLEHGPNATSFHLAGETLLLAGEMNTTAGTMATFDRININTDQMDAPGFLRVAGQNDGNPSTIEANDLEIGSDSFGKVLIEDGAKIAVSGDTEIALFGGLGELEIDGTSNPFQTNQFSTHNLIASADGKLNVTGDSEVLVSNILLTQEAFAHPGFIEVSSPQASLQIDNELRFNGGNVRIDQGASLITRKTTVQQQDVGFGFLTTQLNIESNDPSAESIWFNSEDVFIGGTEEFPNPKGGEIRIDGAMVQIDGRLKIWEAGRLVISETNQVSSRVIVDEIDNSLGGLFSFESGTLSFNFFEGDLDNLGGTIAPGDDIFGNQPGEMLIAGNYFQYPDASLVMDLDGVVPFDGHDVLQIGGFMVADGRLDLRMQGGFQPDPTDQFALVSAANIIGSFSNVASGSRLSTVDGAGSFRVDYGIASPFDQGQIVLSEFQPGNFVLGDVNRDGVVNLLDVAPFVDAIVEGAYVAEADMNGDGAVNLLDVEPFVSLLTS